MHSMLKWLAACVTGALVTGCAAPAPKIDAQGAGLSPIKTVAVVTSPEPPAYTVVNLGHPGLAFGIVGGAVAAADMKAKQDRLSEALRARGTAINGKLAELVASRLAASGYEARVEDAPWKESQGNYRLEVEDLQATTADAVLVLSPMLVGFVATGMTSDYLPTVRLTATLFGKGAREPLYRGYHAAGWTPNQAGWKTAPARKTFANFDALMADPSATADALRASGDSVAESVADDLRR